MKGMRCPAPSRRAVATIMCLLWLLGVEVLPNLHLSSHDASTHEHTTAGTIVTVSFGSTAHAHDGTVHSHDAGGSGRRAHSRQGAHEQPPRRARNR